MDSMPFGDKCGATLKSRPATEDRLGISGYMKIVCRDKDGNVKWVEEGPNLVVNTGIDYILGTAILDSATIYVGLTNGSPTPAAADTMASHGGWTEAAGYTAGTRPLWSQGAAASQAVTNASAVSFTMDGTDTTIGGAFLTTDNTKDGTTGTLIAVKAFTGGNKTVANNDTLDVTYTITGSSS